MVGTFVGVFVDAAVGAGDVGAGDVGAGDVGAVGVDAAVGGELA